MEIASENIEVTESEETNSFAGNIITHINEKQERLDELLCEAVKNRCMKSVITLLDYVDRNLKLDSFNQPTKGTLLMSDACIKWKEKRDIQPLLLAAQLGLADFIKLFLSRGYHINSPHETPCKCQQCEINLLGQTKQRIRIFKAIANPVWICVTCDNPFVSSFRLCRELEKFKRIEDSYEKEYEEMKLRVESFNLDLLDEVNTSEEQYILLNMIDDPKTDCTSSNTRVIDPRMDCTPSDKTATSLKLLKLAIKYKQKKIVAHSVPQHFISSLVYNDAQKWHSNSWLYRLMYIFIRCLAFPFSSVLYLLMPCSRIGESTQLPLVRFIHGASSFVAFLGLLAALASAPPRGIRIGKEPSGLEWLIFVWLISLLVAEIDQLRLVGKYRYFSSGWNMMDIAMIFLMLTSYIIWGLLYFIQSEIDMAVVLLTRSIANGLFTFGTVMSFFRLVYLCQITRFLGLLQLCLGKMIEVIFQFAFISLVVLWSFTVGMTFLYHSRQNPSMVKLVTENKNDTSVQSLLSQGFHRLWTTAVTLSWASLNMVELDSLKVFDDGSIVYLWSSLLFTFYYGVSLLILLNMLIAMMSNSYQRIENNIDVEHNYAKTLLWIDYISYENFLPCPFNLIPTWKTINWLFKKICRRNSTFHSSHRESYQLPKTHKTYKVACQFDTIQQCQIDKLQTYRRMQQSVAFDECELAIESVSFNESKPLTLRAFTLQDVTQLLVKRYLKSKHNVNMDDTGNEVWRKKVVNGNRCYCHDGKFEQYVNDCLENLDKNATDISVRKRASLEDSGLDISFPGEPSNR
eukprot:gene6144-6850_t